jgi:RNA polymerase sigma-70 factor (ECF subfamily)
MTIEPELIVACIKRERRAEYELYKRTYSYLMSICIRYTLKEDEAKEALNLGFLKILNNLNRYSPEIPFKRWIRKIMVNTLIDEFRKKKAHQQHIEYVEEYFDNADTAEMNEGILRMNADEIHALINQLPPMSKQVFNMYILDGFTHKEIAEMLGIAEGTSKWHLSFSKQKLQQMISHEMSSIKISRCI